MSPANRYANYGLSLVGLAPPAEPLSVDDQVPVSPTSIRTSTSSNGSSEARAPSSTESSLASEKAEEKSECPKGTTRTPCADHTPPSLRTSISALEGSIISYAEVSGCKFKYHRISQDLVPKGWSNEPNDLEPVNRTLSTDEWSLPPFVLPILASRGDEQAARYLFAILGKFYFWTPGSTELLFVTQSHDLQGVLQRIHEHSIELETKTLEPLSRWYSQHQITHLPLWFWQIPKGWSQDMQKLEDIKDLIDGFECGLPLPIPILVSDGRDGGTQYFMKCGNRYYIYFDAFDDLRRVEEPTELKQILRVLGDGQWKGLRLTDYDLLPEYGGPDKAADEEVREWVINHA